MRRLHVGVAELGIFDDTSTATIHGVPISLNMTAVKATR